MSQTDPSPAPGPAAPRPRSPQELLDVLDFDQRAVAEHLEGPMCVLAGAGTDKTRTITYQIANDRRNKKRFLTICKKVVDLV